MALPFSDYARLTVRMPGRLHHDVKVAAFHAEVTLMVWVADALTAHLRRCRDPGPPQECPAQAESNGSEPRSARG